jgi:hypothetical protein
VDWARGFPFEAFGLPDQYRRPAPSVALFGFDYDDDFLKVLDEPWPGVRAAEATLTSEARRAGKAIEDYRYERQTAYDRWLDEQAGRDQPTDAREREAGDADVSARTSAGAAGRAAASTSGSEGLK